MIEVELQLVFLTAANNTGTAYLIKPLWQCYKPLKTMK